MNLFQRFLVNQAVKVVQADEQKRIVQSTANPFFTSLTGVGRTVIWQGQKMASFIDDGYTGNDIVYSIIRLIVEKAKVAPWNEYQVVDEQAYKQFQAKAHRPDLATDYKELLALHTKALKPVKGYTKWKELLEMPNDDDTWGDFIEKWGSWKLSTGNSFIYGPIVEKGMNAGFPNRLHDLPTQYMQIWSDRELFPVAPIGYQMTLDGYRDFSLNDITHDKYWNPRWDTSGGQLLGMAPLLAGAKILTRDNQGKTAMVSQMQHGGPDAIIGLRQVGNIPPTKAMDDSAEKLKKLLATEYAGAENRGKLASTAYEPVVAKVGVTAVELEILKAELANQRALCNVFGGIPSELLNDPENKSYNNKREAEKALTTRAAIPLLCSIRDNLNRKRKLSRERGGWGNTSGTVYDFDISCYQELQETKAEKVAWLNNADWIALKQKYDEAGLTVPPYIDQKYLEEIYLKSGQTPISELQVGVDLPIDLNDYSGK